MSLERTIEQWRGCDPRAMSYMSMAAIEFALKDARHDILALAELVASRDRKISELRCALSEANADVISILKELDGAKSAIVRPE